MIWMIWNRRIIWLILKSTAQIAEEIDGGPTFFDNGTEWERKDVLIMNHKTNALHMQNWLSELHVFSSYWFMADHDVDK